MQSLREWLLATGRPFKLCVRVRVRACVCMCVHACVRVCGHMRASMRVHVQAHALSSYFFCLVTYPCKASLFAGLLTQRTEDTEIGIEKMQVRPITKEDLRAVLQAKGLYQPTE